MARKWIPRRLKQSLGLVPKPPRFTMEAALARLAGRGVAVGSVLDLGASDGRWTRLALEHFPRARFLAVEPLEEMRPALERLESEHGNTAHAVCVAGAPDCATARLMPGKRLDASHVVAGAPEQARSVPSRTVDALVAEHALAPPYLLKFDTHGSERAILDGAAATLAETAAIVMEVYNFARFERFPGLCQRLEAEGFLPVDLADPMLRAADAHVLTQMDLFFQRADAPPWATMCGRRP